MDRMIGAYLRWLFVLGMACGVFTLAIVLFLSAHLHVSVAWR